MSNCKLIANTVTSASLPTSSITYTPVFSRFVGPSRSLGIALGRLQTIPGRKHHGESCGS